MIIKSILDTDLYKFTTSYAYMKLYPDAEGTFTFTDRDDTVYTEEFLEMLTGEIFNLSHLVLTEEEFNYVNTIRFMHQAYWEWLRQFKFDPSKVELSLDEEKHLHINITDKLYKVTLYETPILAIISQLRNKMLGNIIGDMSGVLNRLDKKIRLSNMNHLLFSEFGARRRFDTRIHSTIVKKLKDEALYCVGTSDVYMAMLYGMKPCGTFPHEWIMFHGACFGYQEANSLGLRDWSRVYDGDLGIALMDTYTTDVFLRNLSLKHAKLFDGVRQDSGDEIAIGNKVIDRYKKLGIDPTTKTIVFSNALDFDKYNDIARYFNGRIKVSAGIGTNLTNDTGFEPSNIVMKLAKCRINANQSWRNCIKISDDLGKHMGDEEEIKVCKFLCKIN